jgi:hypothetical protein
VEKGFSVAKRSVIGCLQNTSSISLAKKANFHKTKTSYLIAGKLVRRLEDRKKIAMYRLIALVYIWNFLNRIYPSPKHTKAFDYVFFAYQNFYLAREFFLLSMQQIPPGRAPTLYFKNLLSFLSIFFYGTSRFFVSGIILILDFGLVRSIVIQYRR